MHITLTNFEYICSPFLSPTELLLEGIIEECKVVCKDSQTIPHWSVARPESFAVVHLVVVKPVPSAVGRLYYFEYDLTLADHPPIVHIYDMLILSVIEEKE